MQNSSMCSLLDVVPIFFYTVLGSLTSGDVLSPPAQTGGPLLTHAGYSMSLTSNPQTNTRYVLYLYKE